MPFLDSPEGRRIAYDQIDGRGPGVVFLGGFKSDRQGTKALYLEDWARAQGRAFLRFDYSGHGESSGVFEEGCIGDWAADARAAISALTEGPQVLVGSSMGGWISLLLAREMPERVKGFVGIAAAPDFTERHFMADFTEVQKAALERDGQVALPSEYDDGPYIISRRLIEDGRDHLVLDQDLALPFPVRLLQGTADEDVPVARALEIVEHVACDDLRLTLVKGADHRFSEPACLTLIEQAIEEVSA